MADLPVSGCHCSVCEDLSKEKTTGIPIGIRFIVCPSCGNKRCPKASAHWMACTNSNEPGQLGSFYGPEDFWPRSPKIILTRDSVDTESRKMLDKEHEGSVTWANGFGAGVMALRDVLLALLPHDPECATYDFDPEKQLGSDKPCDCAEIEEDMKGFTEVWAKKEAEGYQYGEDALQGVRFGWRLRAQYERSKR